MRILIVCALFLYSCTEDNEDSLDLSQIPSYYFEDDYLDMKIERINQLLSEDGVIDSFVFITDQHWEHNAKRSPLLLRYIQDNLKIKRIFCGGDVADGCGEASYDYMNKLRRVWPGEIHCVVGNHEYMGSIYATEAKVEELFNTNPDIQIGNHNRHYYYVDNYQSKIRYIILSSFSQGIGGKPENGYEEEQAIWLKEVALNVINGWGIILFTHFMYDIGMNDDKVSIANSANDIKDIIETYEGPGRIIAIFQGHNHRDRIIRMNRSNIPVIVTTCDKNVILDNDQLNIVRNVGTRDEQAFDVVIINEIKRQIHCVRIGCPAKNGIGDEVGCDVEERIISL